MLHFPSCLVFVGLTASLSLTACRQREAEASHPFNVNFLDANNPIHDQGSTGSCMAFGLVGMWENDLARQHGVTVDLAERYALRNVLSHLDDWNRSDPGYPNFALSYGIVPEVAYPFPEIMGHKAFTSTSNQLMHAASIADYSAEENWEKTRAQLTSLKGGARVAFLEGSRLFGAISHDEENEASVAIPVTAAVIADSTRVPSVDGTPCFQTGPGEATKSISATRFATACVGAAPGQFSVCDFWKNFEVPGYKRAPYPFAVDRLIRAVHDSGQAASLALYLPEAFRTAIWSVTNYGGLGEKEWIVDRNRFKKSFGHAMVAIGYLTAQDLQSSSEHTQGFLATDLFDRLALLYDLNMLGVQNMLIGRPILDHPALSQPATNQLSDLIDRYAKLRKTSWDWRAYLDAASRQSGEKFIGLNKFFEGKAAYGRARDAMKSVGRQIETFVADSLPPGERELYRRKTAIVNEYWRRSEELSEAVDDRPYPFEVRYDPSRQLLVASLRGLPEWEIKSIPYSGPQENADQRMKRRNQTALAGIIRKEGGLVMLRNSWGVAIGTGLDGTYFATFDFVNKRTMMLIANKDGVASEFAPACVVEPAPSP